MTNSTRSQNNVHTRYTVWLVDDNEYALGALRGLLMMNLRGSRVETFISADAVVEHLRRFSSTAERSDVSGSKKPDVILLDQSMPGTGGIDSIASILQLVPAVKIIMLTNHDFPHFVLKSFEQGASGYILKSSDPQQFVNAIQTVMQGKKYLDPDIEGTVGDLDSSC